MSISGKTISFELDPSSTFADIEHKLTEIENFRGVNYRFIYKTQRINLTETIESIGYDPCSHIIAIFKPISHNQTQQKQKTDNNIHNNNEEILSKEEEELNREISEKVKSITAIGYDQQEVEETLKKFNYDVQKATDFLVTQNDMNKRDDPNRLLVRYFQIQRPLVTQEIFNYLRQTDPVLFQKVKENPYPMLTLLGLNITHDMYDDQEDGIDLVAVDEEADFDESAADDYDEFEEGDLIDVIKDEDRLTEKDNISIQMLVDMLGIDRDTVTQAYLACDKDENTAAEYLLSMKS